MSGRAEEVERRASQLAPGADPGEVREALGEPVTVSHLADGGETWLYVPADPARGEMESVSAESQNLPPWPPKR